MAQAPSIGFRGYLSSAQFLIPAATAISVVAVRTLADLNLAQTLSISSACLAVEITGLHIVPMVSAYVKRNSALKMLFDECHRGQVGRVRDILETIPDITTHELNEAFYYAIFNRSVETMELLHNRGVDVNCILYEGRTPLLHAANYGIDRSVEWLLNHGADINFVDGAGNTALHLGSFRMSRQPVTRLIDAGVSATQSNHRGWRPLHCACARSSGPVVKILIGAGARINRPDKKGYTPLHVACQAQFPDKDFIQELLVLGANLLAVSEDGNLPIDVINPTSLARQEILECLTLARKRVGSLTKPARR